MRTVIQHSPELTAIVESFTPDLSSIKIENTPELGELELYKLVYISVRKNWDLFGSLRRKMGIMDVVHGVWVSVCEPGADGLSVIEKFNPDKVHVSGNYIAKKVAFVGRCVRNKLTQYIKDRKSSFVKGAKDRVYSIDDKVTGTDTRFGNVLSTDDDMRVTKIKGRHEIADRRVKALLRRLPKATKSKVLGQSPWFKGDIPFSFYHLAFHLACGYSPKEIALMYTNPYTGDPLSVPSVTKLYRDMIKWVWNNIRLRDLMQEL